MNAPIAWYTDKSGNRCKHFKTYEELLDDLKPGAKMHNYLEGGLFRGQAKDWSLTPSLYRSSPYRHILMDTPAKENSIRMGYNYSEYIDLRKFYKRANDIGLKVPSPKFLNEDYLQDDDEAAIYKEIFIKNNDIFFKDSEFRNLSALAQHYGVKTRLLDWSRNIFVSLYFAARSAVDEILQDNTYINENIVIWLYSSNFFYSKASNVINPPVGFIVPNYNVNPNVRAQRGVLMYWDNKDTEYVERIQDPIDIKVSNFFKNKNIKDDDIVLKFNKMFLPVKECIKILKHIDKMGYNAYTLFPWYYGVTKSINEEDIIKKCEEIIESSNQRNQVKKNADNYRDIQCSNYKVSAGTGYNLENEDSWYNIKIENTNEARRANFALEISGDSMLPRFENGDVVLVRRAGEVNIGDIGVFEVNGEGYIKKRGEDRLISINEEYEDIYVTENDNFKCFGKVIGKAVLVETSDQR